MIERVREWWQTSDRQTRLIAIASAVGLVVVMIALSFWATQPEWEVLYTGLSPSDSGAIVARLKQAKVPYRLSAGGSTIEVPAQHRDEMLLSLAAEGLPNQGTLGYTRLEKLGFGTTQTVEQETTRIAHEEALQNTISRLQPVAGARVHITPAIDSPFVGEKKPAKASVMVDLKPGQQLTREQIASIVFLVSRSVAGLSPENVSVVDEYANLLWDGSQASDMAPGVASNKLELERAYAEAVQRQLQQQLDAVLGPGKSRLTVTAELDLDREEVNQKQIETGPDGQGTPISETRTEETVRGAAPRGAGSTPGTPTYPTAPAGAPGEYKHSSTTTNYEVGQSTIHRVKTPGRVVRMSVAAMVDASVPQEQVEKVRTFLEGAVGADQTDPNRRFRVIVESIPFDNTLAKEAEAARKQFASRQLIDTALRYLPLAMLLIVLLLLAKALRPARMAQTPEGVVVSLPGGAVPQEAEGAGAEAQDLAGEAAEAITRRARSAEEAFIEEEVEIAPIRERVDVNLESVIRLADQKPEKVAMLIKGWLAEDERK